MRQNTPDHWAFVDRFEPYDAACLSLGIDPTEGIGAADSRRVMLARSRMEQDFAKASSDLLCKVMFNEDGAFPPQGSLVSVRLGSLAIFWKEQKPKWAIEKLEDLVIETSKDFENQLFHRDEIAKWLGENRLPSAFEFARQTIQPADAEARPLGERERGSLHRIIGALVELSTAPGKQRWTDQAALITELVQNYGDKEGISKSGLELKFAEARRRLME